MTKKCNVEIFVVNICTYNNEGKLKSLKSFLPKTSLKYLSKYTLFQKNPEKLTCIFLEHIMSKKMALYGTPLIVITVSKVSVGKSKDIF